MRSFAILTAAACLLAGPALAADALLQRAQEQFKPLPAKAPLAKEASAQRVDLGRKLFFDPRLSTSGLISCNSCHNVGAGGADGMETSIGHGWAKGPRNAPTVLNAVYNTSQFWDGRAPDLKAQAQGPMQALVEMNSTPDRVVKVLSSIPGYKAEFQQAFPKEKNPVTFENAADAIAVFEATLTTPDSPFDRYLKGDSKALDARQKQGLALFMDKGCSSCHGGVNVGGDGFHKFGLAKDPDVALRPEGDTGRAKVSQSEADSYAFRVPTLRNVALTAPYFHTGKVWDLKQAVRVMADVQLGQSLSDDEAEAITAFLHSLTGKQPQVMLPQLPPNGSETPLPQP